MVMSRDQIRPDILARPCEKCGEPLDPDVDFVMTFFRGEFIVLHEECADFIDHATPGPRLKLLAPETLVCWQPASEPPDIEAGSLVSVIAARRSDKGKWYVFGCVYLNAYPLNEDDEEIQSFTGFHEDYKHPDYCCWYEAIDVEFWAPMPSPPEPTP